MDLDKLPKFDLNTVHASTFQGLPPPNNDNPNPLFLKWIAEKYQQACQRQSHSRHNLKKAYTSILQYPVVMLPHETKKLSGIGDTTVSMLQNKFNEYLRENGINTHIAAPILTPNSSSAEAPANVATQSSTSTNTSPIPATPKPSKKRAKTQKEYIPAFQSGPYSILLALRMQLINQSIFDDHFTQKPQLIELAQPHCNVPLDRPLPGSRFTGWSCMRTLTTKELVEKRGKPTKYGLTEEGFELSDKIYKIYCQNEGLTYIPFTINFENNNSDENGAGIGNNSYAPREIDLTNYKIVLVIDNREINTKNTEEFFQKELRKLGVDYCFRQLSVGDFMWIAQPPNGGGPDREVVLDFVVERKLIDDLTASIKDGRYKEQKARLHNCGASKVVYLVENFTAQETIRLGVPSQTIWSSIVHTQLFNDFVIKQTDDILSTLKYVAFITQMLKNQYEDMFVLVNYNSNLTKAEYKEQIDFEPNLKISFQAYQLMNSKSQPLTVSDMFVKMLTCTAGISLTKAQEIVKKYPTPLSMYRAFDLASNSVQEDNLLASKSIIPSRTISNLLSKRIIGEWFKSHG